MSQMQFVPGVTLSSCERVVCVPVSLHDPRLVSVPAGLAKLPFPNPEYAITGWPWHVVGVAPRRLSWSTARLAAFQNGSARGTPSVSTPVTGSGSLANHSQLTLIPAVAPDRIHHHRECLGSTGSPPGSCGALVSGYPGRDKTVRRAVVPTIAYFVVMSCAFSGLHFCDHQHFQMCRPNTCCTGRCAVLGLGRSARWRVVSPQPWLDVPAP